MEFSAAEAAAVASPEAGAPPKRVALLGAGPSLAHYLEVCKRHGGRHAVFDEVWCINALGDVLQCDRVFFMDDVRYGEAFVRMQPAHGLAACLKWLKRHPGPVYTSRPHPDYPGMVAFPLEEVVRNLGVAYFNTSPAYAVAYAIHLGVKALYPMGLDYTFANAHVAEKGRACFEFWLGVAVARGIRVHTPPSTSLLDSCAPAADRFYGYCTQEVRVERKDGELGLRFIERPLPSDEEIQALDRAQDRTTHPNPIIAKAAAALDYEAQQRSGAAAAELEA